MIEDDVNDLPVVPLDDDDIVSPEADLAQAADSAIAASAPSPTIVAVAPPGPVGMTWLFDHTQRRMIRYGGRPAEVRGQQALIQRVQLALHTARFRYPVIPKDQGFDRLNDIVGTVANEEALADFERRLRECVAAVPGCADIANFSASIDSRQGVFSVDRFDIITDSGDSVPLGPVSVSLGA